MLSPELAARAATIPRALSVSVINTQNELCPMIHVLACGSTRRRDCTTLGCNLRSNSCRSKIEPTDGPTNLGRRQRVRYQICLRNAHHQWNEDRIQSRWDLAKGSRTGEGSQPGLNYRSCFSTALCLVFCGLIINSSRKSR